MTNILHTDQKSHNHQNWILFNSVKTEVYLFNGSIYLAAANNPLNTQGFRCGRYHCHANQLEYFLSTVSLWSKELTLPDN